MSSDMSVSPKEKKEEEEAQNGKGVTKPREPTRKEWDEHMLTHIPYRNWCPFCVKGRGRQGQKSPIAMAKRPPSPQQE